VDQDANQQVNLSSGTKNSGCVSEVGWLFSGFVMPLGSFSFFRTAARRQVGTAIVFFVIFTLTMSAVASIAAAGKLNSFSPEIRKQFQNGTIPEIVIHNGIAEVTGPQPVVLLDQSDSNGQRIIAAIDTTGTVTEIDRNIYDQGFLLTRTELHVLSNTGQYQAIPLSAINTTFNTDPIIINGETMSNAWTVISIVGVIIYFIALIVWNTVVRLMILATIALILWGLISLFRPKTEYGPIIVSGIYAIVPVVYFNFLFGRINFSIPFLQTLLLIPLWAIALFACLSNEEFFNKERPLRLWRAFLGIPMLLAFAISIFIEYEYNQYVSWGLAVLTIVALAAIGFYFRIQKPVEVGDIPTVPPAPPA
jgi:hypothetical protein